jgi:hypothetical protein
MKMGGALYLSQRNTDVAVETGEPRMGGIASEHQLQLTARYPRLSMRQVWPSEFGSTIIYRDELATSIVAKVIAGASTSYCLPSTE